MAIVDCIEFQSHNDERIFNFSNLLFKIYIMKQIFISKIPNERYGSFIHK